MATTATSAGTTEIVDVAQPLATVPNGNGINLVREMKFWNHPATWVIAGMALAFGLMYFWEKSKR